MKNGKSIADIERERVLYLQRVNSYDGKPEPLVPQDTRPRADYSYVYVAVILASVIALYRYRKTKTNVIV